MRAIVGEDQPFLREEVSRSEALARLPDQDFKREIIEDLAGEEGEVGSGETVILYRTGCGWTSASGRTFPPPAGSARSR